jgi:hypothetical protein
MNRELFSDIMIVAGCLALATGLWLTVGWWMLVVMGALCLLGGVFLGLLNIGPDDEARA